MALLALGSFALVGLQITGPDMQKTGASFFEKQNTLDLAVMSDYGLNQSDQAVISKASNVKDLEYGYLKDVTIKDSEKSLRIFSQTKKISQYKLEGGHFPEKENEIALDTVQKKHYKIGDTLTIEEPKNASGNTVLKQHTFKITGFVDSSEMIAPENLGQTTVGTGTLNGYAIVPSDTFDSDIYMMARMTFKDTTGLNPYSEKYTNLVLKHKKQLENLLENQPEERLSEIKADAQKEITDGETELKEGKQKLKDAEKQLADAQEQLGDGKKEIEKNEEKLNSAVSNGQAQIDNGAAQIATATQTIALAQEQLNSANLQLDSGKNSLAINWDTLQQGKIQLIQAQNDLNSANSQLQSGAAQIQTGREQLIAGYKELAANQEKMSVIQQNIQEAENQLSIKEKELAVGEAEYTKNKTALDQAKTTYSTSNSQVQQKQAEIDQTRKQLEDGKQQYVMAIEKVQLQITQLQQDLQQPEISEAEKKQLEDELAAAQGILSTTQGSLDQFIQNTYDPGITQLNAGQQELDGKKAELQSTLNEIQANEAKLAAAQEQLNAGSAALEQGKDQLAASKQDYSAGVLQIEGSQQTLAAAEKQLQTKTTEYEISLNAYNQGVQTFNTKQSQYYDGLSQWADGAETLNKKSAEYQENVDKLAQARSELADKQAELASGKSELATQKAEGEKQLAEAKITLKEKQTEYDEKQQEFKDQLPKAEKEIAENETKLKDAQEALTNLELPVYSVNSRREIPGSDGYKVYDSIAKIVSSLANIFPIFLYFVAALVTLTTMTRFVDEERINAGTLKALGYTNQDVLKKFVVYGLTSSVIGALIGTVAGHLLLPYIVYDAYRTGFTLPSIQLHFYPVVTLIALLLAIAVAVLPATIVAKRELTERPARLLLPKPPVAGAKILLERIKPIWNRLSFTQKVTARNIFRYKRRMLMTVFGVCGSVALLFTGLAVQNSISGVSQRQFGDLIHYDLIVAQNNYMTTSQKKGLQKALKSEDIKNESSILFEQVTKIAGANKDEQEITLIVPAKTSELSDYIHLGNRKTGEKLDISGNGVVISERLAKLLGLGVGDSFTVNDENNEEHNVKISGITEMYIGHFMFMNKQTYQKDFGQDYHTNAYMVTLSKRSIANAKKEAAKFMDQAGVKGVVQNTSQMSHIDGVVDSLNQIMFVLILVAAALAIVILYNLTNINVSERIRELSTIKVLGFYSNEVTMYIYRETIILSLLGILVGYGFGALLHSYILNAVPPDNTMFNPGMWPTNFIIPAIITIIITGLLGFIVYRRLKNVDMLEALKSVE
jgi:putative ABC transport system permease protein